MRLPAIVAAGLGMAVAIGSVGVVPAALAQSKDKRTTSKKATTKKTTTRKASAKKATKRKAVKRMRVGTRFLTFYNAKWSQAKAGKCGRQYRLYTETNKRAAKGLTKKLYVAKASLCGTSYWITKRAETCRKAHRRARHKEVVREFRGKGKYAALCPRGAQANIDKAAASRKKNFRKNIKKKKTTTRSKSKKSS